MKIKFKKVKCDIPVVKFWLDGGEEGYGILDTGSETSLVDIGVIKRNKECFFMPETPGKVSLVGIGGDSSDMGILFSTNIRFRWNSKSIKATMAVYDMKDITESARHRLGKNIDIKMLFGSDLLAKNNITLDFKNNCMIL